MSVVEPTPIKELVDDNFVQIKAGDIWLLSFTEEIDIDDAWLLHIESRFIRKRIEEHTGVILQFSHGSITLYQPKHVVNHPKDIWYVSFSSRDEKVGVTVKVKGVLLVRK